MDYNCRDEESNLGPPSSEKLALPLDHFPSLCIDSII